MATKDYDMRVLVVNAYIEDMVHTGLYGSTDIEVAQNLILEGIRNAIISGVIKQRDLPTARPAPKT